MGYCRSFICVYAPGAGLSGAKASVGPHSARRSSFYRIDHIVLSGHWQRHHSYADLEHGLRCPSRVTFALFLTFLSKEKQKEFLSDIRSEIEKKVTWELTQLLPGVL